MNLLLIDKIDDYPKNLLIQPVRIIKPRSIDEGNPLAIVGVYSSGEFDVSRLRV
jgi:hypothetical protein